MLSHTAKTARPSFPTGKRSHRQKVTAQPTPGTASPGCRERGCPLHTQRGRPEGRELQRWEPRCSGPAKPAPRTSEGQQHPVLSPQVSLTSQGRSGLACLGLQSQLFTCSQHVCPPPVSSQHWLCPWKMHHQLWDCSLQDLDTCIFSRGILVRKPDLIHIPYPYSGTKSSSAKSSHQLEKAPSRWRRHSVGALWGEDAWI